jgi:DNA-binding NtrC family response regulator
MYLGMRLVASPALLVLKEILEDVGPGAPVSIACHADPGVGATTFLRQAARLARTLGYVPVAGSLIEQTPDLMRLVTGRSVLVLCDTHDSARAGERSFFRLAVSSRASHVLLRMGSRATAVADLTLALEPLSPKLLAALAHTYPPAHPKRIQAAADESGGLPARFLERLRGDAAVCKRSALRVAEAHPAYKSEDTFSEPEVEHPWRDLIADAVRLAGNGRAAAATRDLRQIVAAAERRQVTLAAAVAEVELAYLLLARGRTREAKEVFSARVAHSAGSDSLATRAAMGLGVAHLLDADLESAESTFRVCRTRAASSAASMLAWTLLVQGRESEAERALTPAREARDAHDRAHASIVAAAIALARQDLSLAAREAGGAHAPSPSDWLTAAFAPMVLTAVHGRIGDEHGVELQQRRAVRAATTARSALTAVAARATSLEARHRCGKPVARETAERLLRVSHQVPALVRAHLWSVVARIHPSERVRAETQERLDAFVRTTGARFFDAHAAERRNETRALDTAALLDIYESSAAPIETLKRVAEWLRERVNARAVLICDGTGSPLARSGAQDAIASANRVLTTRLPQPPWPSAEGLESAVVVRDGITVQGVIACRWPLSRPVTTDVVGILMAASSIVGPAIALMVERAKAGPPASDGIVGRSAAITRLREQITRAGLAPFPVLIEGESGVGKELVARAIHRESTRRLRGCVAINCAALSDDLFESEVFGHARGAFTGAQTERAGLFEQADGGTLFLDEVAELSPRAQAKLLRTLQEGEVRRLGENHTRRVDVRVIAASNRRLEDAAAAGSFRRDLLFRLTVIRIAVPPLRERREDIPLVAGHYWNSAAARSGARSVLTPAAIARLSEYDWPGNVRELQNVIAALVVHVPRGRVGSEHVEALVGRASTPEETGASGASLEFARQAFERQFIATALARAGGRHGAAARQLGISRQGLAKLMKRLGI